MAFAKLQGDRSELTEKSAEIRSCLIIFNLFLGRPMTAKRVFFEFGILLSAALSILYYLSPFLRDILMKNRF